jgi:hypothetical protein
MQMISSNLVVVAAALAVLISVQRQRRLSRSRVFGPPSLAGLALGLADAGLPGFVFGLLCLAPAVMGQAVQSRSLLRQPDIQGVSAGYLLTNLFVQILWLRWSFLAVDSATTWCAAATACAIAANVALYVSRRAGWLSVPAIV